MQAVTHECLDIGNRTDFGKGGRCKLVAIKAAKQRHEDKLNLKLCGMLVDSGLDAEWQSEHKGNTKIDMEVFTEHLRVAVECEKHGSGKRAEALKDAVSRLVPVPRVDAAIALVYPEGCDSPSDLTPDTILAYTIIRTENVKKYGGRHKRHAQSIRWMTGPAGGLASVLKHLYRDVGDPDRLAGDLKTRLDEAVGGMSVRQCSMLAKAIRLEYPESAERTRLDAAAKRALLVVASAALFHARVGDHIQSMKPSGYSGLWPPQTPGECRRDPSGTKNALVAAWELMLKIDYRPIFESAINILVKSSGPQFAGAVESMAEWAIHAADQTASLRHDLLGRIFHTVLDTARQDGSFYTTTPAAVLLAGLAIRNRTDMPNRLRDMKVVDPACGTGTLLMAAAERIRDIAGDEYDPNVLVEEVLCGIDINVTAVHMAATTVGMLSPDTKFDWMDIRIADLGLVNGKARAGSLELYAPDGLLPYVGWYEGSGRQVDTGSIAHRTWKGTADLVVMNPPFTRNNLRHDQLGPAVERAVKEREKEIFRDAPVSLTSSGIPFLLLGERLAGDAGTMAFVFPLAGATAPSNADTRRFLAKRFHVDTIVVPHDTKRFQFSGSTDIAEMLVILRREPPRETRIVNLAVTPGSVAEAAAVADAINGGRPTNCQVVYWPRRMVETGNWAGVLFYSPYLVERFAEMLDGIMFKVARLGDVADTGEPPQGVRMTFDASDIPDKDARFARYDHKTNDVRTMRAAPNRYLRAKPGREKQAERAWAKGGLLHIPERLQPNITHVAAVRTDNASIGTSWHAVTPRHADPETWSKAMAVYINSTVGVVAMLGARIPRKPLYPRYSVSDVKSLLVPALSETMIKQLATTYDRYGNSDLGLWRDPNSIRIALDHTVCGVLNLDGSIMATMRQELSREPMVTGRRYGE